MKDIYSCSFIYLVCFKQSISIQQLLQEAYTKFGDLTASTLERLRFKHRVRVVQQLEEGEEKNVVRSVIGDGYFTNQELHVSLFSHLYTHYKKNCPLRLVCFSRTCWVLSEMNY